MRRKFHSLGRIGAILAGTLLLLWPAFYNRFPLIFPDSMSYVEDGPRVARALFLHQLSDYYGLRSLIYPLGIVPFHWNATPWPVATLQALLTAFICWLVVRSVLPQKTAVRYLTLLATLALFTGVGWVACLLMPDCLGALLYLCLFLLIFAPETLARGERWAVCVIAWWAATAHVTHLMLATGICVLLAVVFLLRGKVARPQLKALGVAAIVLAFAVIAPVALNWYLSGKPSLTIDRPPYLTARLIVDGPGRWYLEKNCATENLAICAFVQKLPDNTDDILWNDGGLWMSATPEQQDLIIKQEGRFVLETVRAYPRQQAAISMNNFWLQLTSFGVSNGPNEWMKAQFATVMPQSRNSYAQSRQAQETLPNDLLTSVQNWAVIVSILLAFALAPFVWRLRCPQLGWLAAITVFIVVANAFVTGVLSEVDDRYQTRVVWLLPLLAGLFLLKVIEGRKGVESVATKEDAPAGAA